MFQRKNGSLDLEENDQITQKEKVSGDDMHAFQCIIDEMVIFMCSNLGFVKLLYNTV